MVKVWLRVDEVWMRCGRRSFNPFLDVKWRSLIPRDCDHLDSMFACVGDRGGGWGGMQEEGGGEETAT